MHAVADAHAARDAFRASLEQPAKFFGATVRRGLATVMTELQAR
jgi:hypothetical protein